MTPHVQVFCLFPHLSEYIYVRVYVYVHKGLGVNYKVRRVLKAALTPLASRGVPEPSSAAGILWKDPALSERRNVPGSSLSGKGFQLNQPRRPESRRVRRWRVLWLSSASGGPGWRSLLPATACDSMHRLLPARDFIRVRGVQRCSGAPRQAAHLAGPSSPAPPPGPLEMQTDNLWPKAVKSPPALFLGG